MVQRRSKAKLGLRTLPRFLAATTVVAMLYIALQEAWSGLAQQLMQGGFAPASMLPGDADGARRVAELSDPREASLSTRHRRAALMLGFDLGYVAALGGATYLTRQSAEAKVTNRLESYRLQSKELAGVLGVSEATPLVTLTVGEHLGLAKRIDTDENGLAGRIEAATTLRHKHLFLLGAHVGLAAANIDFAWSTRSGVETVPSLQIAFHAKLAGVPECLWRPFLEIPSGNDYAQVAEDYRGALMALDQALASRDTIGGPTPSGTCSRQAVPTSPG